MPISQRKTPRRERGVSAVALGDADALAERAALEEAEPLAEATGAGSEDLEAFVEELGAASVDAACPEQASRGVTARSRAKRERDTAQKSTAPRASGLLLRRAKRAATGGNMIRRSAVAPGLFTISLALSACGGSSNEPVTPDTGASASAAASTAVTPPPATATPTASAVATAPPPAAPQPGADVKIVAMKMSLDPKGAATVELKADGTVWMNRGAKSVKIGAFSKNAFATDDGTATIAVWKDNSITVPGQQKKLKFDDKDTVVVEDGATISIDDKGKLQLVKADGTQDKGPAPTVTGFKPEGRRAALFLTLLAMSAPVTATTTGPVSTPPAVQPKH